jgi:hypothetical protein
MVETFHGTPDWYGGSEGIIKKLVERARDESLSRYRPYGGERIAPFTPMQKSGFRLAEDEVNNPRYNRLYGESANAIRNALGENISDTISPYLQGATANPTANIDQYMNPYTDRVVDQIATLGNRNLQENILPSVQNKFINAGQYGSTGHQNFTNRAVRDTAEGIAQAQGEALQGGYNTALQTSVGQQERKLQAGQLAGSTANQDVRNKLVGSDALQNLASNQQTQGLRGATVLGQLGGQQQQQAQNQANTAYQEYQNERNFPLFQTARLNEIVRGLPVNTQQFGSSAGPQAPQASPWTQGAGLLASAAGAFNQRPPGFAKGGSIKKLSAYRHYAEGGRSTPNPIQAGVNDAMDTAELKSMRDEATRLQTPQVDPFWAAIARGGASIAANRQPGALAALGQGMQEGLSEYQGQLKNQDNRGLQSAKIMNLIDNTRRLQAERDRTHQLNLEKFGQHKKEFGLTHGLAQEKWKAEKEKINQEKNLIKGPGGMMYEIGEKDGKRFAIPLEGMDFTPPKTKAEIDHSKKINEEAKKNYEKRIKSNAKITETLENLEKSNKEIGTGEIEGFISNIPLLGKPVASAIKSLRGGQTAIDRMKMGSNDLVSEQFKSLPAKAQSVAHHGTLKAGKPDEHYTFSANEANINEKKEEQKREVEKAKFGLKMLKKYTDKYGNPQYDAPDIEAAYDNYYTAKKNHESLGKGKFSKKPEDFLVEEKLEFGQETIPEGTSREEDVSNEDIINDISDLIE